MAVWGGIGCFNLCCGGLHDDEKLTAMAGVVAYPNPLVRFFGGRHVDVW